MSSDKFKESDYENAVDLGEILGKTFKVVSVTTSENNVLKGVALSDGNGRVVHLEPSVAKWGEPFIEVTIKDDNPVISEEEYQKWLKTPNPFNNGGQPFNNGDW